MRVLEARFHPFDRKNPTVIVMALVIWDDAEPRSMPRIEPAPALERHTAPGTVLATLRYLVQMTSPHSFERLQRFDSRFWSFVPVES